MSKCKYLEGFYHTCSFQVVLGEFIDVYGKIIVAVSMFIMLLKMTKEMYGA